jgi:hypothetical protein
MRPDRRGVRSLLVLATTLSLGIGGFAVSAEAQGRMFVSNYGTNTINVYPRDADGTVPPILTITNGLNGPNQLAISSTRELYVANNQGDSVTVYNADTGALLRTLAGASTGLYRPGGIALDEIAGTMYVTNDWPASSITVYSLSASGDATPLRTIQGAATGLSAPVGIAIDRAHEEIIVTTNDAAQSGQSPHPAILFFDRLATGDTPAKRAITGPLTTLALPLTVVIDPVRDEIIVANRDFVNPDAGAVLTFQAGVSGNVAPIRRLEGENTRLCNPYGLALDLLHSELVVANSKFGGGTCLESVATFDWPPSIGDQAPIRNNLDSIGAPGTINPVAVALLDVAPEEDVDPVVTVPDTIVVEATSPAGASVDFVVSATDSTGTGQPVTCSKEPGETFALGTTTVTCSATDFDGNTGSASFTVTVRDTIAPRVTVPDTISVEQTSPAGATVTYAAPVVVEKGSGLLSWPCAPASGTTLPVGSTTVICTATDNAGNVGVGTFTVIVTPSATPPATPDGRMYGIGHVDDNRRHQHFVFRVAQVRDRDYGRLEFWTNDHSRCPSSDHDHDRDHNRKGDHDRDYGRNHRSPSGHFQATSINATFKDDPAFRPGSTWYNRPTVDSVTFSGAGKWNGRTGYTYTVTATDQGEPGRRYDTFSLVVKDSRGNVVANVSGGLDGGNIQSTRLMVF